MKHYEKRGVMLDVTRGRVPKLSYLKQVVGLLAENGINQLQLYMEHTFRFSFYEGTEMAERCCDGYTAEDIKTLDDYCHSVGVELVPCIATFGHLFELLQSKEFSHLCELDTFDTQVYSWMDRQLHHTIDCSNPESLELVKKMIQEISACYRSPYLNICGDETFDIGAKKSKAYVEQVGQTEAYIRFLNQVIDVTYQCGKTPMYWGDVILKHPDQIHRIHEKAIPLHWWYEVDVEESDFKTLYKLGRPFYTCPAAVGWNHFINHYDRSITNIDKMLGYGAQYGAVGGLITDWGDFGHINHLSTSIPMLVYGARRMQDMDDDMDGWNEGLLTDEYRDLLADIGNERLITFEETMKWYYEHFNGSKAYGDIRGELEALSFGTVEGSLDALESFRERLKKVKDEPQHVLMPKVSEVNNALDGMKWMLNLVTFIKVKDYGQPSDRVVEAEVLKESIAAWFKLFSEIWLRHNRPSELFRIEETIDNICEYIDHKGGLV